MGTLQNWRMFSLAEAAPLDAVSPDIFRIVLWLFPWRSRRKWLFQECLDSIPSNTKGWVMELHCGQADGVMINKLCCHQGPELGMLQGIPLLSSAPVIDPASPTSSISLHAQLSDFLPLCFISHTHYLHCFPTSCQTCRDQTLNPPLLFKFYFK